MNLLNWIILITLIALLIIALYFWNRERKQRIELGYICDEYAKLEKINQETLARYKDKIKEMDKKYLTRKEVLDDVKSVTIPRDNVEVKDYSYQPKEEVIQCICGGNNFIEFENSKLIREVGVIPYYTTSLQCVKCGKVHDLKEKVEGYSRYQKNFI